MLDWLKRHFEAKAERRKQEKINWLASEMELHATGMSSEAMWPIMALGGDVVTIWDELSEDQKNWFRTCGEVLAEEYNRPGFRAMIKLRDAPK